MTMFDEARAIKGMISMKKMTQSEVARLLGTSQSFVANKIRLLNFPDNIQRAINESRLTERHARALLRIPSENTILEFIEKIKEGSLSVSETEALLDAYFDKKMPDILEMGGSETKILNFEEILYRSIKNLKGGGVDATMMTSYFGDKKYITISLPYVEKA